MKLKIMCVLIPILLCTIILSACSDTAYEDEVLLTPQTPEVSAPSSESAHSPKWTPAELTPPSVPKEEVRYLSAPVIIKLEPYLDGSYTDGQNTFLFDDDGIVLWNDSTGGSFNRGIVRTFEKKDMLIMFFLDYESPEINEEVLEQLLDLCFQRSDYFSFSIQNFPDRNNTLETELVPYICNEIDTSQWFSYITLPENPIKRVLYLPNNESLNILKRYCHRLFLFDGQGHSWTKTLEDLCFFSSDKLILGTVSHEFICQIYPPDEAFEAQLFEIYSHWKTGNDYSQQIKLSDYAIE